jgi:hypothetical protein
VTMPMLETDFNLRVCASLDGLTSEMRADRMRKQQLAAEVAYIDAPAISFGALPYAPAGWGPNSGYNWAIQRVTMSGFGATTDYITVYRGNSTGFAVGAYALYTFQEAVSGGVATWHPGRTGLVLKGDESIVFGGTFTGTTAYANIDVVQLTDAQLPYFLL